MKSCFFTILIFSAAVLSLNAQISGVLIDSENSPAMGVNIVLLTADSVFITGTASDINGVFVLNTSNNNDLSAYVLAISSIGYENRLFRLEGNINNIDIGTIVLQNTQLDEVTVTVMRSITQTDRQLIFPPQHIVRNSRGGFDLLNKLMLSGLNVDVLSQSASKLGGGNVAIYINERRATQADVITLRPDEVLRIEYIDMPGAQYANDNVEAVIHFIVKRRISGTVMDVNTTHAVTTRLGNFLYSFKYNHNRSEFGINYLNNYTTVKNSHTNQTDTYTLIDNTKHIIDREGINNYHQYRHHWLQMTYNLSVPQKYVFETNFRGLFYDSPNRRQKQRISETNQPTYYALTESPDKLHTPSIDLFYRIFLPNRQTLTANLVGTSRIASSGHRYKTFTDNHFLDPISEHGYEVYSERYSLISEVRHNKQFEAFSLITGANYMQSHTQSQYTNTGDVERSLQNTNTYLYSQIQGHYNKFGYTVGLGTSYYTYQQDFDRHDYCFFRPALAASYRPFHGGGVRYGFRIQPSAPTLVSMSDVRQQINNMEYRYGNPNLKPFWEGTHTFALSYQHNRFSVENTLNYARSKNTIMEEILRRVDEQGNTFFELGVNNQKNYTQLRNYISGMYYIVPEKLTVRAALSFLSIQSNGNSYSHSFNYMWSMLQANLILGKWGVEGRWSAYDKSLFGETVSTRPAESYLHINYPVNNVTIGLYLTSILLKNGYQGENQTASQFLSKKSFEYIPERRNTVFVSFLWNFNRGREYQSQQRTLNNSDSGSGII